MKDYKLYLNRLRDDLQRVSSLEKAESSRRYFPDGIDCIGATAKDIKVIATDFHINNSELSADDILSITEYLLKNAKWNEETLVAFGILNKYVKNSYDDSLLERFEFWLEHYTDNWAQVDDLCIKTIYQFFMARPQLIEKTKHWSCSKVSWCRRASNVVWVKFIKRKIGKSTFYLDKSLIFRNCDLLIQDKDEYVQKSVGWLLKVASVHYEQDVINYLQKNCKKMTRTTIRYAIEKLDAETRKRVLETTY